MLAPVIDTLTDVGSRLDGLDSNPRDFTRSGDQVFFVAQGRSGFSNIGTELWRTDGTPAGTQLVKDIQVGAGSSNPHNLFDFNGTLYFAANFRLWKSDGTTPGTVAVGDAYGGSTLSSPNSFTVFDGKLYFVGLDRQLWTTDGTAAGTVRITSFASGTGLAQTTSGLTSFGGRLYFAANDGVHGYELWSSDGTAAGTSMFKDINPGASGGLFGFLAMRQLDGVGYFMAGDASTGQELWRTDGTDAGTMLVHDILSGNQSSYPAELTVLGSTLYFVANDAVHGFELWKYETGAAQAELVKDIAPGGPSEPPPAQLTVVGDALFFVAQYSGSAGRLWTSDGTSAGTRAVLMPHPTLPNTQPPVTIAVHADAPRRLTALGNSVYFAAPNAQGSSGGGIGIWRSDGTLAGSGPLPVGTDFGGTVWATDPLYFTRIGDELYFSAVSGSSGREPWTTDGTTAGTGIIEDITGEWESGGVTGGPSSVVLGSDAIYFAAPAYFKQWNGYALNPGSALWKLPLGGSAAAQLPGTLHSNAGILKPLASVGNLLFYLSNGAGGLELWRTDGTEAGNFRVKDINPGSGNAFDGSVLPDYLVVGSTLYFIAHDGVHGRELWKTDGAEAGTVLVKNVNPAGNSVTNLNATSLTYLNGKVLFAANDGTGLQMWSTDGTDGGTVPVTPIASVGSGPTFTKFGDAVYFAKSDAAGGVEPWRSDGTSQGTSLLLDIRPGAASSLPTTPAEVFRATPGLLYILADDGVHSREWWATDGTAGGTHLMADLGLTGFTVVSSTTAGGLLYFVMDDGTTGRELWRSDGTEAGTFRVTDIAAGSSSSFPIQTRAWTELGGAIYFATQESPGGKTELWRTDGSSAGTTKVLAAPSGFSGSAVPQLGTLTEFEGSLYFNLADAVHGIEFRVLRPDRDVIGVGDYDQDGVVTGDDFLRWQRALGGRDATADGDGSGTVDAGDLGVWRDNFGAPAVVAAVTTAAVEELAAVRAVEDANDSVQSPRAIDAVFSTGDFTKLFDHFTSERVPGSRRYRPARRL